MSLSVSLHKGLHAPDSHANRWRSLAPHRDYATSVGQLYDQLIDADTDSSLAAAFAQGMSQTTRALADHFPENIFADIDFLAAALLAQARRKMNTAKGLSTRETATEHLSRQFIRITDLVRLYGLHSAIRFRYMHDFLYGFDWARWVRKQPQYRHAIGPFDSDFLDYLHQRGGELLALIDDGDSKYPPLIPGQWRNPFGFARTPTEEVRLHLDLAADDLVPVASWDPQTQPVFDRDFHQLRQARAERLYG